MPPADAAVSEAVARAKREGNARFTAGDFAAAARHYSAAIAAAAGNPAAVDAQLLAQAYNNRAAAHLKLEQWGAAHEDAARAAQLTPQWGKPHLRLAEAAAARRDISAATRSLSTAKQLALAAGDRAVAKEADARQQELEGLARRGDNQETETATATATATARPAGNAHTKRDTPATWQCADGTPKRPDQAAELARQLEQVHGDVGEALKLYEDIAKIPENHAKHGWRWHRGIGEALGALGRHYATGTHYARNDALAVDYLTRGAALGSGDANNSLGVMAMNGTHGQEKSVALAKAHFRRAAERQCPIAMLNLIEIHRQVGELDIAARWAEAAARRGVLSALDKVKKFRDAAKELETLEPAIQRLMKECYSFGPCPGYVQLRLDHLATPTLAQLRTIKTPYGRRLVQAKKLMLHACESLARGELAIGVSLASQAYKFDDATLVCTPDEMRLCEQALQRLVEEGQPMDPLLALVLQPPPQSTHQTDAMDFWYALHEQYPDDFRIAACAARVHSFVDGEDERVDERESARRAKPKTITGLKLYRKALSNLSASPDHDPREVDPNELGFWFLAGLSLFRSEENLAAKILIEKFLEFAAVDGHRFGGEAHFILGLIEMFPENNHFDRSSASSTVPTAAEHLRLGTQLQQRVPVFLQPKNRSSNQHMLEAALQAASESFGIPIDMPHTSTKTRAMAARGGELLTGPARHAMLEVPVSPLVVAWKKERADAHTPPVLGDNQRDAVVGSAATAKSDGRPAPHNASELKPTSVDEIVSGLDDHTYRGRVLEGIVVAALYKIHGSYEVIVEDSRREPIRVVLKDVTLGLLDQLLPGQVLRILHPRLGHGYDQTAKLLVLDPARELVIGAAHTICWNCGVAPPDVAKTPIQSCSQCHRAKYCSRDCQKQDWKQYGHRYSCSPGV